jgi:putative endopeptidase
MSTNRALVRATACALLSATAFGSLAAGIDRAAMDTTVAPGHDFWSYVNGAWVKSHPIPADRSSYGVGAILVEDTNKRTADLIQGASHGAKSGSDAQKVGDYYASFMDEAGIQARGITPIKPMLARVAAITDRASLARYLGESLRADVDALNTSDLYTDNIFGLWVSPAPDDPTRYAPYLMQGGLGMPDREYYVSDADEMKTTRTQYQAYIGSMLKLAGIADADAKAARILALEIRIAQGHAPRADADDVQKGNNSWTRAELAAKAPGLDWNAYLSAAGLETQPRFIAWHPTAIVGTSRLVTSEPVDAWKDYLAFRAVDHYAAYLPRAFVERRFAFYGTALEGTPQIKARWKRAVDATNEALGEAVGRLYVTRYFPPESRAQVREMVANITAAFEKRVEALAWMAPSTKTEALRKLSTLKVGTGYPDTWRDYSALEVVRGDVVGNVERYEAFEYLYRRSRLGKPVDRDEWVTTPQTVNAFNLPILNAMNFPAAFLQPPFFDPKATAAINYGAIGAVIGHEINHSFDDLGAQFDAGGHLRNWWTDADLKQFQAAGAALALQYDGYKPFPDLGVNGRQTLSENIADLAGLAAAYDAYRASLLVESATAIDGFTGDQQFFLSYARTWCSYQRPEALRQRLITDGHAPGRYRALTVRNLDPWYAAFPVKPGESLYLAPDERVKVW